MRRDFTRCVCILAGLLLVVCLPGRPARGRAGAGRAAAPASPPAQSEPARDTIGRDTPRNTVLGFINAARKGNNEILPLYLDTGLKGQAAIDLAHKLYVVLDSRLPARLNELSDRPEALRQPLVRPERRRHHQHVRRLFDVIVERLTRNIAGLAALEQDAGVNSDVREIDLVVVGSIRADILGKPRPAVRLQWLVLLLVLPAPATVCWDRSTGVSTAHGSGAAGPGSATAIRPAMCPD